MLYRKRRRLVMKNYYAEVINLSLKNKREIKEYVIL